MSVPHAYLSIKLIFFLSLFIVSVMFCSVPFQFAEPCHAVSNQANPFSSIQFIYFVAWNFSLLLVSNSGSWVNHVIVLIANLQQCCQSRQLPFIIHCFLPSLSGLVESMLSYVLLCGATNLVKCILKHCSRLLCSCYLSTVDTAGNWVGAQIILTIMNARKIS